ncbi:MAG: filamentous hemagglutinin N-terminal domain-containing protein [Candidatus Pacebacteria bacterium]|nr:filamentous hemagglutinin N-terminal domain-containing protein [Candidatus Paceibacterota bacterium]
MNSLQKHYLKRKLNSNLSDRSGQDNLSLASAALELFKGSSRLMGTAMVSLIALATMVVTAPKARALPTGGQVVAGAGSATITTRGAVTEINQTSNRAVIEWQSFNVASNESVNFKLPNASGATLNRIRGAGVSTISGTVTSNGSLFFVNPNGMIFDVGSKVSVNSFVATTVDLTNSNFMAGQAAGNSAALDFNKASSVATAVIKLQGTITAASMGQVAVFGPQLVVASTSTINASRGAVFLGNYQTAKLSWQSRSIAGLASSGVTGFYGVSQTRQKNSIALATSFVQQDGLINAEGGLVTLVVAANSSLQNPTLSNYGTINAPDLLVSGILYSGSASLSAIDGSVNLFGGAVNAGGGGLLVNGTGVGIFNTSLKVKTLTTGNGGVLTSKNAAITIVGKTVTITNATIIADSSINDLATTTTRVKSGDSSVTILADQLTLKSNLVTTTGQIDSRSTKLSSLITGNSQISLMAKDLNSSFNRLVSTSAIAVTDPKRVNNLAKMTVQTGNSSIAYVSDDYSYRDNSYQTDVRGQLNGNNAISGARLGKGTTLLNGSNLVETAAVEPIKNSGVNSDANSGVNSGTGSAVQPEVNPGAATRPGVGKPLEAFAASGKGTPSSLATKNSPVSAPVSNSAPVVIPTPAISVPVKTEKVPNPVATTSSKEPSLTRSSPSVKKPTASVRQASLVPNSSSILLSFQNQALVIDAPQSSGVKIEPIKLASTMTPVTKSLVDSDPTLDDEDYLKNRLADAYARHFGNSKGRAIPFTDPDKAQPGLGFGGTDGLYGQEAPNPSVNLDFGRGLNQGFAVDEIKSTVPLKTLPAVKLQEIILHAPRESSPVNRQPELKPISLPLAPRMVPWHSGIRMQEIKFTVPAPAVEPKSSPLIHGNEVYVAPRFNRIRVAG